MDISAIIDEVARLLDVENPTPKVIRGQKHVLRGAHRGSAVAVKMVVLSQLPNSDYVPVALERAEREVNFLLETDHPNVVKAVSGLVDIGDEPSAVAWLEEWIEGDDLSDLIKLPWSWNEAKLLGRDVADGLTAFHEQEVVHRDLSANNIRRDANGRYRVMDPGLSRFIAESAITGVAQPGTYGFMSPEHVLPAAQPIYASDIFCLGILLFLVLTGELPVPVGGGGNYGTRLANGEVADIRNFRDDLSEAQIEIVSTCLEAQAPRRYHSARRLLEALENE